MFNIKVDTAKNRIYATLGPVESGEGEKIFNQIKGLLPIVEQEYTVVSDISNFTITDPDESIWVVKTINLLINSDIKKIVGLTDQKRDSNEKEKKDESRVMAVETIGDA